MKNDFMIAETACSHNGDIKELKRLIKRISKTKVNVVKFQIYYPEERTFKGDDEYDLFHRLLLSQTEWSFAISFARSHKLKIFADIFGYKSFSLAKKLKVDGFKIHSEDSSNYIFVKKILDEKKPTFVSISGLETRELEDLIIETIYAGVLQGRLNQKEQLLRVHDFLATTAKPLKFSPKTLEL